MFTDKQSDHPNPGQKDDSFRHLKDPFLRDPNGLISPQSLGQVTHERLLPIDPDDTVGLNGSNENPSCLNNRVENNRAGIPTVHQHRNRLLKKFLSLSQDLQSHLHLRAEQGLSQTLLGMIRFNSPRPALAGGSNNRRHGAQPLDQALGPMMDAQPFDFLAVPLAGSVIDDQGYVLTLKFPRDKGLTGPLQSFGLLRRIPYKMMQTINFVMTKTTGYFTDRAKLHQPNQPRPIRQTMFDLRAGQYPAERGNIRSTLLRKNGFHKLSVPSFKPIDGFGRYYGLKAFLF